MSTAALLLRKPFSAGHPVTAAVVKDMIKIHAVYVCVYVMCTLDMCMHTLAHNLRGRSGRCELDGSVVFCVRSLLGVTCCWVSSLQRCKGS